MGVVNLVVLASVLRATTKKRSSTFSGRKVHPRENPGYAYGSHIVSQWKPPRPGPKFSLRLICLCGIAPK